MSLLKLLSDFPNYSAWKVRKLANQLRWLEQTSDSQAKDIAADLIEFNLQQAKLEEPQIEGTFVRIQVCPGMSGIGFATVARRGGQGSPIKGAIYP